MKQILLASLIALSFSGLTYADNGVYTSLKAGISDTKYKNSEDRFSDNLGNLSITFKNENQTKSIYPNISAAIGFDFSKISKINARAELEYTYKDRANFSPNIRSVTFADSTQSETTDVPEDISLFTNKLKSQSIMLNGYYDFKNKSKFTPYISAGIGATRVKNTKDFSTFLGESDSSFTNTSNHLTWSTGVGVAYNVTNNVALDLSYKYLDAGKLKFKNTIETADLNTKVKLNSQDYALGIRYNF